MSNSRESQYSASHDKHFFDTFMLVLGGLVAFSFVLYIMARVVAANTQEEHVLIDPTVLEAAGERIKPVALLAVAGEDNSALAPVPGPAAAPAVAAGPMTGEQVYTTACVACHGQGIGGAPTFGDRAAWGPRIAQGMAILNQHAVQGFQGQAGLMPAKGGRVDLADEAIVDAVEHMVNAVR